LIEQNCTTGGTRTKFQARIDHKQKNAFSPIVPRATEETDGGTPALGNNGDRKVIEKGEGSLRQGLEYADNLHRCGPLSRVKFVGTKARSIYRVRSPARSTTSRYSAESTRRYRASGAGGATTRPTTRPTSRTASATRSNADGSSAATYWS